MIPCPPPGGIFDARNNCKYDSITNVEKSLSEGESLSGGAFLYAGAALESSIRPFAVGKADLETQRGFQPQINVYRCEGNV